MVLKVKRHAHSQRNEHCSYKITTHFKHIQQSVLPCSQETTTLTGLLILWTHDVRFLDSTFACLANTIYFILTQVVFQILIQDWSRNIWLSPLWMQQWVQVSSDLLLDFASWIAATSIYLLVFEAGPKSCSPPPAMAISWANLYFIHSLHHHQVGAPCRNSIIHSFQIQYMCNYTLHKVHPPHLLKNYT